MSDKKITQLPPLTAPTLEDLLAIVNSSVTKNIKLKDLFKSFIDTDLNLGFFLVPAGQTAPDGEYYYTIKTDIPVPIQEGEISSGTPTSNCNDAKSKLRVDHSLALPNFGWNFREVDAQQINDLLFTDHFNGFAVTESGKIYKTIDCGRTWTQKFSNSGANPIKALASTGLLGVIALPGQEVGKAMNISGSQLAVATLFDSRIASNQLSALVAEEPVKLPTQFILFAVGGTFLYYSSDFGETWTPTDISVSQLLPNERYISISVSSSSFSTAYRSQGSVIFVLGSLGTVVQVISDGAGGFTPLYLSNLPEGTYTGITTQPFAQAILGVVIYVIGNAVRQTIPTGVAFLGADGQNWDEILTEENISFYGLSFSSTGDGRVAGGGTGGSGIIFHTEDFGDTWTTVDLASIGAGTLRDIFFDLRSGIGWAVGDNSTIVISTDNGVTWTKNALYVTEIGTNKNLLAVSAIFDGFAYVAGNAGNGGLFYYFLSDTVNGVKYTYTPVDTVWMRVKFMNDIIKEGFVTALNVEVT